MRTKITAILIFMFITIATMPVYYIYRSEYIEKDYIHLLSDKNAGLKPLAEKLNREQSPDSEKLKKLFNDIIVQDRSIAALAVTDRMERLKFMVKNDALLNSGRVVDELVKDIREKNYKTPGENIPSVKNYSGSDWLTEKLYIFSFTSGEQSTIAVYSFIPDRMTKIRLALEAILIISGLSVFTAGIIILLRKTGILQEPVYGSVRTIVLGEKTVKPDAGIKLSKQKKEKPEPDADIKTVKNRKNAAVQIEESELSLMHGSNPDVTGKSNTPKDPETEAFNSAIFTLFKKIHKQLSPASVSLYIKRTGDTLSRTYELKGKNFIRIDSGMFDFISISEIEKKINPVSRLIYSENSLRVPLYDNREITGLIEIVFRETGLNHEISQFKGDINSIAKELNGYLTAKSIITDKETGFFSRAHFALKLNQNIHDAANNGAGFSLLLINLFSGTDSDKKQKDTILNIMFPTLQRAAGERRELFLHKDFICMILTGTSQRENENIKSALSKEISKFKIKITEDHIITLNPQSVLCGSADSKDLKNMVNDAEAIVTGIN